MNKLYLAEEVKRIIDGGDATTESNVDIREVVTKIGNNLDARLKEYLDIENRDQKNEHYKVEFSFLKPITIPLTNNRGPFPIKPMMLEDNISVYQVRQNEECDAESFLAPMQATQSLYAGLESEELGGILGYYIIGNEIIVNVKENASLTNIYADIVPCFRNLGEEEEFDLPGVVITDAKLMTRKELEPYFDNGHDNVQDNADKNDWKKHKHRS